MEGTTKASAEQIEQELAELLDQEIFEPPADFREKALIQDESVYEEAARDPAGLVGEAVRGAARLGRAVGHGARRVRGALLQVVRRAGS